MQACDNRILHMSDRCREYLDKVRGWCKDEGIEDKLDKALKYLRTFSMGCEDEWKSELMLDLPHHEESRMFICTVFRRIPKEGADYSDDVSGLRHYMTLGMVWREDEKDWSFHS